MTARQDFALPALRNDTVILRLEAARNALAEADTIQKTKTIVDVAAAALVWAKRHQLGKEAVAYAQSVEIEAFRKMGQQLRETPKATGTRGQLQGRDSSGATKTEGPENGVPTLAELGITYKESAIAQKLAGLPDKDFEAVRDGHVSIGRAIAQVDGARKAPKAKSGGVDPKLEKANENLQAKVLELEDQLAATKESLAEMTEMVQTLKAFEANEGVKEMQVLRVELRSTKRRRDELMRENVEQKKLIAHWKKKAGAK